MGDSTPQPAEAALAAWSVEQIEEQIELLFRLMGQHARADDAASFDRCGFAIARLQEELDRREQ